MKKYACMLSGEDLRLATEECRTLLGGTWTTQGKLLTGTPEHPSLYKRLAFTREVYEVLLQASREEVKAQLEKGGGRAQGTVSIERVMLGEKTAPPSSKDAQRLLMAWLGRPKVSLKKPDETYKLIVQGHDWTVGRLVWESSEDFEARKNQRRPAPHPTSLHPKLARCLVNLAGPQAKTVLDPFCGSGGILLEASLMGLETSGIDLEEAMIDRARKNLAHYGAKASLVVGDALETTGAYDAIVTDLPYGRNSKASDLESLYDGFLMHAKKLTAKMVVSFPDTVDERRLIEKSGWKKGFSFKWRLHRSLGKNVHVLRS